MEAQITTFMDTVTTAHNEELNEIRAENKTLSELTEKFMGQMKTQLRLLDKMAKQLDNNRTTRDSTTGNSSAGNSANTQDQENVPPQRQCHKCPSCQIMCFHKLENCPETNEAKRWPGWTTRL